MTGLRYRDVGCVALLLAYAWAGIDTRLIHHGQGLVFSTAPGFAGDFLKHPGGPGDYLYALIAQAYAFRTWGAIVLTAQVVAAAALIETYSVALARRTFPLLRLAPALVVLLQPGLYFQQTRLKPGIPVALALAVAFAVLARRRRGTVMRIGAAAPMLAAAYYLGGVAAAAVFALAAAAVFLRRSGKTAAPRKNAPQRPAWRWLPAWTQTVLLLLCLGAACVYSHRINDAGRRLARVYYRTYREDWPAVLKAARGLKSTDFNPLIRYQINLALHETNRLADEMFRFPQADSVVLEFRVDPFVPYSLSLADMCLRLGRVNEAEHFAGEALVGAEFDPRLYRLMARTNMVKGQRGVARKILTALSYDLGSGQWARAQLFELARDPESAGNPDIQRLRERMNRKDDVVEVWQRADGPVPDITRMLQDQLAEDPSNRTAFEFLMGACLLARDLPSVNVWMPRIKDMTGPAYVGPGGARRTPRHYQEAMALFEAKTGQAAEIEGLEIQPETRERLAAFSRIVRQFPSRDAAMRAAWGFRDSYFFFFAFGPGDYR
jgi:hypothetical protein